MVSMLDTALLRAKAFVDGLRARLSEERGQDLLEYALLGGLVAAGIAILAGVLLGVAGVGAFNDMASAIQRCIDFDDATSCP
jgi:Flp pilus assembly pilin Flp